MSNLPPPPPPPPPPGRSSGSRGPGPGSTPPPPERSKPGRTGAGLPKWTIWVLLGVLALALLSPRLLPEPDVDELAYSELKTLVAQGEVEEIKLNNNTLAISGTLKDGNQITPIANGKLTGDQIMFNAGGLVYAGQVSGDSMQGTLSSGGGWTASRVK